MRYYMYMLYYMYSDINALIRGKNPSVLRTLTANLNTNPNPTNPTTLLTLWIFPPNNRSSHHGANLILRR